MGQLILCAPSTLGKPWPWRGIFCTCFFRPLFWINSQQDILAPWLLFLFFTQFQGDCHKALPRLRLSYWYSEWEGKLLFLNLPRKLSLQCRNSSKWIRDSQHLDTVPPRRSAKVSKSWVSGTLYVMPHSSSHRNKARLFLSFSPIPQGASASFV